MRARVVSKALQHCDGRANVLSGTREREATDAARASCVLAGRVWTGFFCKTRINPWINLSVQTTLPTPGTDHFPRAEALPQGSSRLQGREALIGSHRLR